MSPLRCGGSRRRVAASLHIASTAHRESWPEAGVWRVRALQSFDRMPLAGPLHSICGDLAAPKLNINSDGHNYDRPDDDVLIIAVHSGEDKAVLDYANQCNTGDRT